MINYGSISSSFPIIEKSPYLNDGGDSRYGFIMLSKDILFSLSPFLVEAHNLLLSSDPIGRIGNYRGVYELSNGIEIFTPDHGADPGAGKIGETEMVRVITFSTYFEESKVPEKSVAEFVHNLAALHPWEHPVIKILSGGRLRLAGRKEEE
jgi:hypothetical protein